MKIQILSFIFKIDSLQYLFIWMEVTFVGSQMIDQIDINGPKPIVMDGDNHEDVATVANISTIGSILLSSLRQTSNEKVYKMCFIRLFPTIVTWVLSIKSLK